MLDDQNVLAQRDPDGALNIAATQYEQTTFAAEIENPPTILGAIQNVVVAGMGGSGLAALQVKTWLKNEMTVPFEVVRDYTLPHYVNETTLVIASSYSGNTEETLSALQQAAAAGAAVAVVTSGGRLADIAATSQLPLVKLPSALQPRMAVIYNLRALVRLLVQFGVVEKRWFDEIAATAEWLKEKTSAWGAAVTVDKNYAKQLALLAVGKSPVIYAGSLMAPVAYKWKISWNENAKNVAFWNELPEFNHNEFVGWSSHPVEKPFAIFDLVSSYEHQRTQKRFAITSRLLSGLRPKETTVELQGDSLLAQMLWGSILADFTSIYVAVLNGVNPTPVELVERLKVELTK